MGTDSLGTDSTDSRSLLAAYDEQLRTDAETAGALDVRRFGPLWLVTFDGGDGFVTYRDLGGADRAEIGALVAAALGHFANDAGIVRVEWKTRSHDVSPGLPEALTEAGFTPGPPESIMLGRARSLAVDVPLPDGVALRRIETEAEVRAMCAMADEAFGEQSSARFAESLVRRLAGGDGMELWVAEAGGAMVGAGRLEPVPGSDFAGVWGGATLRPWRGRGIYRALTAARARSALALGKSLIHSDSTEYSRPILERSGLIRASTTTPYVWSRG